MVKEKISKKTNGRCFYCNKIDLHMEKDHFISKAKWREWDLENTPMAGKLDSIENLFLSCRRCNRKKIDKCPEDFIENPFKAWDRYSRANHRVGLSLDMNKNNLF